MAAGADGSGPMTVPVDLDRYNAVAAGGVLGALAATLTVGDRTTAQANATGSAQDYVSTSGFSRSGLIQQLSSHYGDGYTKAQATYAANHVGLSSGDHPDDLMVQPSPP
jgi:Host cell surface-exposed lipoprotein